MQLLDIKNDLAKLVYTPISRELCLADFLIVGDDNQNILAQIINIESTQKPNANMALVKFILSVDKDGVLCPYNGYVPSKDAQISYVESDEIVQLLKNTEETIPWGALASHPASYVSLDFNMLKNNLYIQCDNRENNADLVSNIVCGLQKLGKKVVIVDFDNNYESFNIRKYAFTKDFNLPLNYEVFDYIYDNDLDGMDLRSRAIVQDILLDLQKYVKETPDKFLPFNTFLRVVDDEYKRNPSAGIILIRNKLLKYAQQKLFAQTKQDVHIIKNLLDREDVLFLDLSTARPEWQKIALNIIIEQLDRECFVVANLTEINSDKRTIAKLYEKNKKFYPIVTTTYNYPDAQLLKGFAKNLALFTPIEKLNDFAAYNSFLSKLNEEEFILWGHDTMRIPLIIKLVLYNNTFISRETQDEIVQSVDNIFRGRIGELKDDYDSSPYTITENDYSDLMLGNEDRPVFDPEDIPDPEPQVIEIPKEEEIIIEEPEEQEDLPLQEEPEEEIIIDEKPDEEVGIVTTSGNLSVESLQEVAQQETIEEISSPEEIHDEIDDLPDIVETEQNEKTEEIQPEQPEIIENVQDDENVNYDEIFTDEDLDFIDELNEEAENTEIPIFEAKVEENNNNEDKLPPELCVEGTFVMHPKYGKGMIEKVINYGNKTLCSIQFDNVGRRLLDPNLAELKEV